MGKENKEGMLITAERGFKHHEIRNSFGAIVSLVLSSGAVVEVGFQGASRGALTDLVTGIILGLAVTADSLIEGRQSGERINDET